MAQSWDGVELFHSDECQTTYYAVNGKSPLISSGDQRGVSS